MDLILWRHADAADGVPDAARELTPKGVKQAHAIARWLRRNLPHQPVTVMASAAMRAQQTARAYAAQVQTNHDLGIGASAARMLKAAQWPNGEHTVVIVGHQPALGAAAALALTGKAAAWPIKKGAIWWLRSSAEDEPPLVVAVVTPRLARAGRGD